MSLSVIAMPLNNSVVTPPMKIDEVEREKRRKNQKHYNRLLVANGYYKEYYAKHKEKYNKMNPEKIAQKQKQKELRKAAKEEMKKAILEKEKLEKESMRMYSAQTINYDENGEPTKSLNISVIIRKPLEDVHKARRRILRYVSSVIDNI
jgi:hypothetical protein